MDRLWSTLDRIVVTNSRYSSETVITSFDREKLKKGLVIHIWPLPYTCYNVDLLYADGSTIEDNVATFMQPGGYVVINMTGDELVVVVNATIGVDHVVLDMSARARAQALELGGRYEPRPAGGRSGARRRELCGQGRGARGTGVLRGTGGAADRKSVV